MPSPFPHMDHHTITYVTVYVHTSPCICCGRLIGCGNTLGRNRQPNPSMEWSISINDGLPSTFDRLLDLGVVMVTRLWIRANERDPPYLTFRSTVSLSFFSDSTFCWANFSTQFDKTTSPLVTSFKPSNEVVSLVVDSCFTDSLACASGDGSAGSVIWPIWCASLSSWSIVMSLMLQQRGSPRRRKFLQKVQSKNQFENHYTML